MFLHRLLRVQAVWRATQVPAPFLSGRRFVSACHRLVFCQPRRLSTHPTVCGAAIRSIGAPRHEQSVDSRAGRRWGSTASTSHGAAGRREHCVSRKRGSARAEPQASSRPTLQAAPLTPPAMVSLKGDPWLRRNARAPRSACTQSETRVRPRPAESAIGTDVGQPPTS